MKIREEETDRQAERVKACPDYRACPPGQTVIPDPGLLYTS